jgi:hypothetical protein
MIGFLLFFNPATNNLHFVEVYTQHHRLDHHLSPINTLLNTRRKRYGAMGDSNGEDQLCLILGVVVMLRWWRWAGKLLMSTSFLCSIFEKETIASGV